MITKEQIIDVEDAENVLLQIEKSLNLNFQTEELKSINKLGDLCELILRKIDLQEVSDCTTQQAFNKIRNCFKNVLNTDYISFHPDSELEKLIPRKNRRKLITEIEQELGFRLNILTVKKSHFIALLIGLIFSIIILFFQFLWGWIGLIVFSLSLKIAFDLRKEFKIKTVREFINKITRENYIKSRRDINTVNKSEVEKLIYDSFNYYLGGKEKFTSDTVFK